MSSLCAGIRLYVYFKKRVILLLYTMSANRQSVVPIEA